MIRNSQCPNCGKYFHHLGLASHRARCYEKMMREKEKQIRLIQEAQPPIPEKEELEAE